MTRDRQEDVLYLAVEGIFQEPGADVEKPSGESGQESVHNREDQELGVIAPPRNAELNGGDGEARRSSAENRHQTGGGACDLTGGENMPGLGFKLDGLNASRRSLVWSRHEESIQAGSTDFRSARIPGGERSLMSSEF
jgi:hypothetical protein